MFKSLKTPTIALAVAAIAGTAFAASHIDPTVAKAIGARHAQMQLYSYNLGTLGAMAQDKMPYDAAAASAAAANLAALANLDQAGYWIEGSDSSVEGSRALAAIWTDMGDFETKAMDLATASTTLAAAAGTDLDSLKAAFGPVGGACGACHKAYRVSNN